MAEPFLAELRLFSFGFPPKGWALCNGQLLPINQNQALFSLLGTTYGGDGRVTFGLPNLQARIPAHMGNGYNLGAIFGENAHTLSISEMPAHNHTMSANSNTGTGNVATGAVYADAPSGVSLYKANANPGTPMNAAAIANTGGSQPHENRQPFLVLNWCIALQGIFPSQN
jgi:microcystin-dependent protein